LVFLIIENVIIISGFILIFRSSILAGFIILGIYLFIFIWMQIGGSTKSTRKTMLSAYINIKKANPLKEELNENKKEEHEKEILFLTLVSRFRIARWYNNDISITNHILKGMVNECPNIDDLSNFVILFEFNENPGMDIMDIQEVFEKTQYEFYKIKKAGINIEDYIKKLE